MRAYKARRPHFNVNVRKRYNLFYSEGPGTTEERMLTGANQHQCNEFIRQYDNCFAVWRKEEV